MMPNEDAHRVDASVEPRLRRVHNRALGLACAALSAVGVFAITAGHVMLGFEGPLGLLNQYFYGYDLTWTGAAVGSGWGAAAGFLAGWLLAFVHNATMWAWGIVVQLRQGPAQASDLLDNI